MPSLRPPSAWADAQRAFHLAYDADPEPHPRQPVILTWRTRGDLSMDPLETWDDDWSWHPNHGRPPAVAYTAGSTAAVGLSLGVALRFPLRLLSSFRHGVTAHDGLELTVTSEGDGTSMTFSLGPKPAPYRPSGRSTGVLVGELGMNAVACVEIAGRVLWPTTPPVERPSHD